MGDIEHENDAAEQDPRFPSGEWSGFFLQPRFFSGRVRMTMTLSFKNESLSGEGQDAAGQFIMRGRYNTKNGEVIIHKRYRKAKDVAYRGFAEATGKGIWGVWEIPQFDTGGWHIWPKGHGNDAQAIDIEADEPIGCVVFSDESFPATADVGQAVETATPVISLNFVFEVQQLNRPPHVKTNINALNSIQLPHDVECYFIDLAFDFNARKAHAAM